MLQDFVQGFSNLGSQFTGTPGRGKEDPQPRPEQAHPRGFGYRYGRVASNSLLKFAQEPNPVTTLRRLRYIPEVNRAVKFFTPGTMLTGLKFARTFKVRPGRIYRVKVTSLYEPIQDIVVRTTPWRIGRKRTPALTVVGVDTKISKEVTKAQTKAAQTQRKDAKGRPQPSEESPRQSGTKDLKPHQQVTQEQQQMVNAQKEAAKLLGVEGLAAHFYFFAEKETYVNIKVHLPGWYGTPEPGLIEVDVYDPPPGSGNNPLHDDDTDFAQDPQ